MASRRGDVLAFPLLGGLLVFFLIAPLIYFVLALSPTQTQQVLLGPQARDALGVSLATATTATVSLAVLAVPLGYLLARREFPGKALLHVLVFLPLICPPAASGILLLLFFGPNQGFGRLLRALGVEVVNTPAGIVLAQMFVAAPFVIITARAAFEAVPVVQEHISLTLGEGPWMTFWRVSLPQAATGILAGIVFAWMRSMGEFGATLVMAYHPYTLPVFMWVQLTGTGLASALPVVLLAIAVTLVVLGVVFRLARGARLTPV